MPGPYRCEPIPDRALSPNSDQPGHSQMDTENTTGGNSAALCPTSSTGGPIGENGRFVSAVSGASSGLGAIFARRFAEMGHDLFLVARRGDLLAQQAETLSSKYGVRVETMRADVSRLDQLEQVEKRIERLDNLEYMVNSAGFGGNREFPNVDIEIETRMIQVHCIATMRLCRAALIPMVKRNAGKIINISSASGYLAGWGAADYTGTKAYLLTFSRSLQADLRKTKIRVQALAPGFIRTEFHDSETMKNSGVKDRVWKILWIPAEKVVSISLKNINRKIFRGVVCIPTYFYKLVIWAGSEWWLAPLRILFSGGRVR